MGTKSRLVGVALGAALHLRIAGKPVPCPRPRVTRYGATYYPKSYSEWREAAFEQVQKQAPSEPFVAPVEVSIETVVERPKTTVLTHPRGDVDNFAKAVLDTLTKARVWVDDTLVRTLHVTKRWATSGEAPGYNIMIEGAV